MSLVSLKLPTLKLDTDVRQTCEGRDMCSTCPLYKTFCHGCSSDKEASCGFQKSCSTNCNECHGEFTERLIPGVCCKSPLRDFAVSKIRTLPDLVYKGSPRISFPDERIPVLLDRHHGSPSKVNAIGMHRVFSVSKGWKSTDLKDYLQLDKKSKLVLLTVMRDNHLDNFADTRWYETVGQVGFDYWQPLQFSIFASGESQMQRLFSFWRIMQNLADSGGHMVPFANMGMHRLITDEYQDRAVKEIPNIFVNASHGSEQKDFNLRLFSFVRRYAAKWSKLNPVWLFQGVTALEKRKAVRSLLPPGASCYFFITPKTGARRSGDQYGWHEEKSVSQG